MPHESCYHELNFMARLREQQWRDDLPDAVEEFCEVGDSRWFTSTTVGSAITNALANWRDGTIEGGQFGEEPLPTHHVEWQQRTGKIAQMPQWHHWCRVELIAAIGQVGAEFARIIREDYRWADDCSGGELLFAGNVWRANFVELATYVHDPIAPLLSWDPVHSPEYRRWSS